VNPRHAPPIVASQLDLANAPRGLQDGERAPLDAYWTPAACALACVRAVDAHLGRAIGGRGVLEPSVGGGAWVRAVREVWPASVVHAVDLDPEAPGLDLADHSRTGDFLSLDFKPRDVVLGNPPYCGDLVGWLDRSLEIAPVVAYLLRATVLGSSGRAGWWQAHPPAAIWTLSPRPKWQGPGERVGRLGQTDTSDSVLVLWDREDTDTRHRWLPWVAR
jgi:hypothetical protein